jgi:uncharacterized protein YqeY
MSVLEKLTRDRLAAFKAGDKTRATLLATVIGEARSDARREAARDPTEEEVLAKIRKFIKNNEEAMAAGRAETVAKLGAENEILDAYLPRRLADDDLRRLLQPIVDALAEKSPKAVGQVMAAVKGNPQVDMKRASAIVKELLGG